MERRRAGGVTIIHGGKLGRLSRHLSESTKLAAFAGLLGETMANDHPPEAFRGNQLELFGGEPAPASGSTADDMREFLCGLLAEARAAETMPWPPLTARLYRGLFPQLSFWLPEEESAQLRFEFEAELERLQAA